MGIADLLTPQALIKIGVGREAAARHAPWMAVAAERFGINTPRRAAAFVGQCAHETAMMTAYSENLSYSRADRILAVFGRRVGGPQEAARLVRNPQALANRVYASRFGNGDEASGDGWRYRGRGAGHLTFKDNYTQAGLALYRPYVSQPDLVAEPEDAALTFAWYWRSRLCNEMADTWTISSITRTINPGMAGAAERAALCAAALRAMSVSAPAG